MKKASEIYKPDNWGWYDYQPMLNEFGTILVQEDEDNYQGDSFLLYLKKGKYGFLSFGWGSCSGCDALQACANIDEVQELMDQLHNSIIWFDSLDKAKEWLNDKENQELKWYWSSKEFQTFVEKVLALE